MRSIALSYSKGSEKMPVLRKEQIEARLVQSRQEKRRNATPEELKLLKNCLKEQQRYANEEMKLLYVQFDSLIIQVEYDETTISFTVKNTKCVDEYTITDSYFFIIPK